MSDKCIVKGCSNRKDQGKFVTDSFLADLEGEKEELRQLLKDTWMMLDHATKIDFSNGNVHAGQDEGNVRGWEYYHNLRKKVEELGII